MNNKHNSRTGRKAAGLGRGTALCILNLSIALGYTAVAAEGTGSATNQAATDKIDRTVLPIRAIAASNNGT